MNCRADSKFTFSFALFCIFLAQFLRYYITERTVLRVRHYNRARTVSSFKIWSKIIERCLVKLNCFPICYDFFFWFVFTKNLISRNFLNPLKSKIYLVGNWKDAFTLGDDALAASEFERLEVSEAVGLDALEKSGMI